MKYHLKHLLLVVMYLLYLQQPVKSHKQKQEEHTIKDSTKKDIVTPAVTLAASIASTYLMSWLKKTTSALANINNLSKQYLVFDKCDGINVEIPVVPTNLAPGKLGSEMQTFNPAGVFSNLYGKLTSKNIWVRCAYETNFRKSDSKDPKKGYNPRSKIVFLATLRGTAKKEFISGWETDDTTLAIAMCDKGEKNGEVVNGCQNFEDIVKMKNAVEERIKEQKDAKSPPSYPKMRIAAFEKKQGDVLNPIYFCSEEAKHCVSAIMGNGGNSVTQLYVHDYQTEESFKPQQVKVD